MKRAMVATAVALVLSGCASLTQPATTGNSAVAEIKNATGQTLGLATLTEVPGGVRIVMDVKGLPPGAKGVHIHEVGRCEGPKFESAGAHFNPDKKQHGVMNPQGPHAGDLPNITIGSDGTGRLETTTNRVTLRGGAPTSVFDADGSAIVIHAAPDDFVTDPTGNSGGRAACGVIVKK